MVRTWVIFFLLLASARLYGQKTDLDEIGNIIDSWGERQHAHSAQCGHPVSSLQPPECPLTLGPFCEVAKGVCRRNTDNSACLVTHPQEIQSRVQGGLRYARANLTRRFNELKNNMSLERHCCGDYGTQCWGGFRQTRLQILPSNHPDMQNSRAHYDPNKTIFDDNWFIRVSEEQLAQARSMQELDRILFHEFGHACQHYIAKDQGKMSDWRESNNRNIDSYVGFERVHPAVRTCIQNKLNATNIQGVDLTTWKHEIFADIIYAKFNTNVQHWAFHCSRLSSPSSRLHPSTSVFLECLLLDPAVQSNFCAKK